MNPSCVFLACVILCFGAIEAKRTTCDSITAPNKDIQDCTVEDGSLFFLINGSFTWSAANNACKKINSNAHLATIENFNDYGVLVDFLDTIYDGVLWIGLSDTKTEGKFLYVDDNTESKYFQWMPGSPNQKAGNSDDCVFAQERAQQDPSLKNPDRPIEIYAGFVDGSCSRKGAALCEIDV